MKRYQLPPDVLDGAVIEADETWSGCAGAQPEYRLANGVTILAPRGKPFDEVKPPLPPEPPVGSVVMDQNGRVWQCRAGRPGMHNPWQSIVGGQIYWSELNELAPVRLVPDPFAEPVKLPWESSNDSDPLTAERKDGWLRIDTPTDHASLTPEDARRLGLALITAAEAEATP